MQKLRFMVELNLDENWIHAATPEQVRKEILRGLTAEDAATVGIQIETVQVVAMHVGGRR